MMDISGLASMVSNFFDKKAGDTSAHMGTGISKNQKLTNELHRFIITRKFERRKVHLSYRDNNWGVDLVDMQFLST